MVKTDRRLLVMNFVSTVMQPIFQLCFNLAHLASIVDRVRSVLLICLLFEQNFGTLEVSRVSLTWMYGIYMWGPYSCERYSRYWIFFFLILEQNFSTLEVSGVLEIFFYFWMISNLNLAKTRCICKLKQPTLDHGFEQFPSNSTICRPN